MNPNAVLETPTTVFHLRLPWWGEGPDPDPGVHTFYLTVAHAAAVRAAYAMMADDPDCSREIARRIATNMAFRFHRIDTDA